MSSYLQARKARGTWLVRIDDIDPPREQPGATKLILQTLQQFGFQFDGPTLFQSENSLHYKKMIDDLGKRSLLYACQCSRKTLAANGTVVYPGTCRDLQLEREGCALRVKLPDQTISFEDKIMGLQSSNSNREIGDQILIRRDGLVSYLLANVIDDERNGISEVVRGADLLHETPRQLALIKLLDFQQPEYLHIPVATNSQGQKLSKQTGADALVSKHAIQTLSKAWQFLQQPTQSKCDTVSEFWTFAEQAWDPGLIPMVLSKPFG